ncbi:hypothetical protein FCU45_10885 [Sulfurimonas crateris]|uniref:Uncharacterized protein n=1 Tax=Sulfurimonas crateris TaxID=2574727 RepID=A0A4U2Z348_9BACT|nr:hypothetical protein [Sulfurimonas crateris]TKI68509.1 hypothetical protein FCU45_10885 [Sulfurimonas crateris]
MFDMNNVMDTKNKDVQKTHKFFQDFFNAFAKETINFYEHWGMLPFTYKEKQLNSVVTPAIYKITNNVWLEQPFKARGKQRFLDIATVHGDSIYLIELKHSWNSKKEDITKNTDEEWEVAIEQIADLKRNTVKQFVNHKDFNIFRIALMVMPTYLTNDLNHGVLEESSQQYAEKIFNKYQEYRSEKYRANYVSTWKVEECIKYIHEYDRGKQIFPFISFIARIEQIFD